MQSAAMLTVQYCAYGNVLTQHVEEIESSLRFQGQYYDAETGLHYNRHRYYSPSTGRFTTVDPIGLAGGLNNYQYVPNPTGWVDPLGLTSVPDNNCARIAKLDQEGHAVIRHGGPNRVTDSQLEDRAMRGIDPASGTQYDAFNTFSNGSPKLHKVGRNATAFTSDEALLQADDFARSSIQFQSNIARARASGDIFVDPVEILLKDIFGNDYQSYVRGVTRLGSKNNPTGHMQTNFIDGTIKAIYKLDQSGNIKLHTLYPNPKP